jgi:hypothetical protein
MIEVQSLTNLEARNYFSDACVVLYECLPKHHRTIRMARTPQEQRGQV